MTIIDSVLEANNTTRPSSNSESIIDNIMNVLDKLYGLFLEITQNPFIFALIEIAVILFVSWLFTKIVDIIVSRLEYRAVITKVVGRKIRSIVNATTYIIALIAIIYSLTGITTLIIPIFIVLAAILFSMWEFFANIIGYYTILTGKMILQDVFIRIERFEGRVKDITPMSIVLESLNGSIIRIPSRYVFSKIIEVPSRNIVAKLRITVEGIPVTHVTKLMERIRDLILTRTKRGNIPGMQVNMLLEEAGGNSATYTVSIVIPRTLKRVLSDLVNEVQIMLLSELSEYDVKIEYLGEEY